MILGLLRDEPGGMYGLELVKTSEGRLSRGTVYVLLGRLEEKGYVRSSTPKASDHSGLPRPRYKLTAQGQRVLEAADIIRFDPARV